MQPVTFDSQRTIPSPEVTMLMLSALKLSPKDKVLEIGTGSGFQTEEWAKSGAEIHSIELEPYIELTANLGGATYLHHGDGSKGIPHEAPFTAIVATCGVEKIPQSWQEQLGEKGRMIVPLGDSKCQKLTRFVKFNGEIIPEQVIGYVRFLMMKELPEPKPMKPVYAGH